MSQILTYEEKNNYSNLETYEWDNAWIEQTQNKSANRVFYIGDSISYSTRNIATALSNNTCLFDGFATSKALDNPFFFESVKHFAAQLPAVETVIFNNGLHGWHLDDETDYKKYYEEAICFLCKEFKDKKIFLVLTTSVSNKEREERVIKRNKVVLSLAEKYNLPIIDLYSVALENAGLRAADGVHFSAEGNKKLAGKLLEEVSK